MDRKRKTKKINLLDLFSGIGGFSLGLQRSGQQIGWHGYSDIDKYANKLFKRRFKDAERLGTITNISYKSLKERRIDLLTGGFPCQSFSIAGLRKGFSATRGTLFFEIARILKDYIKNGQPIPCILLENVKGLLSHDSRRTFATIYKVLADLNYTLECQVVNTRWFPSTPQNRERIFIFGRYNGNPSGRKVFPIGKNDIQINYGEIDIVGHSGTGGQRGDIHSPNGIASCLSATDYKQPKQVLNQIKQVGSLGKGEGAKVYDSSGISTTIKALGGGWGAKSGLYKVKQIGTRLDSNSGTQPYQQDRVYDIEGISPALSEGKSDLIIKAENPKIRRLTPTECERLQGFPDGWTDGQSDTQRYKQCGNAVSVPVVKAIMEKIYG